MNTSRPLLRTTAGGALCLVVLLGSRGYAADALTPEIAAILPEQFPGYSGCQITRRLPGQGGGETGSFVATRPADGFSLRTEVTLARSASDTDHLVRGVLSMASGINTSTARSYTGRRIAPVVNHSHPPGGGEIRGSTHLLATDGRVFVRIIARYPIPGRANGRPIHLKFAPADFLQIEDLMVTILDRATALGYTSRSARSVSATLRRAVAQRRNVLRATPPKPAVRPPSPNPMIPPPLAERWRSNQPPPRKRSAQ